MRKLLLTVFFVSGFLFYSQSQTILLQYDFTGYNGLASTMPSGWYASWHDTSLVKSFYTSSGFYGVTAPAYKFGIDSTELISPMFSGADSVRFYMKGNGTPNTDNIFFVYGSTDSITWNLIESFDSISPSSAYITLPLTGTTRHLRFYYSKPTQGYNVGLDDIEVFSNTTGIQWNHSGWVQNIQPNPASLYTNIGFDQVLSNISIRIYSMLGNKVLQVNTGNTNRIALDVAALPSGVYMVNILSEKGSSSRKLVVKR